MEHTLSVLGYFFCSVVLFPIHKFRWLQNNLPDSLFPSFFYSDILLFVAYFWGVQTNLFHSGFYNLFFTKHSCFVGHTYWQIVFGGYGFLVCFSDKYQREYCFSGQLYQLGNWNNRIYIHTGFILPAYHKNLNRGCQAPKKKHNSSSCRIVYDYVRFQLFDGGFQLCDWFL